MKFIQPLYYFDAMVTGQLMHGLKLTLDQMGTIKSLIAWKLGKRSSAGFDEYLLRTFEAYTSSKQQILIDLYQLNEANNSMSNLIVHSVEKNKQPKDDNNQINLLRGDIAKTFPRVKSVIIPAGFFAMGSNFQFTFSLIGLLRVIQQTNWQQVTISAQGDEDFDTKDWISELWPSKGSSIAKEYNAEGYDIKYEYKDDDWWPVSELTIIKH